MGGDMAKDLSKYVPGSCESDIRRLKSDVGAVMSDLDEFRMRMADVGIRLDETGSQVMSAGAGFDDTDTRMSGSAIDGDERAFEVFGVEFDDSGAEKEQIDKWTVYVPSGCVQIDGVAVKFDNEVSEDRVSVSPEVKGGVTLHCVVWKDKDGTAHAKICVGNGEKDALVSSIGSKGGTLYASVPFCTLSDTYEDNNQIHLGAIVLTSGKPRVDEVSTDFKQAVDDNGNPVTEKKEVNGVQKDVPVKTEVIEIKGWHEDGPVDGSTLAGLMGLPVKTGVVSKDVIVRDGMKGGELKYYSLGEVDKEALAGDPCRVASIGDGTVPGSTLSDKGLKVVEDAYVEVAYAKAGDCPGEGEVGYDDCKFMIPVVVPSVDFSMDVTDVDVAGTTDHPNGGVKVTLSPSAGLGTNFTVWNGKDGAPGDPGAPGAPGDPGRSIVSASSGDPSQDGDYTVTPITFVDNAGNMIGPVDVKAKNGSAGISGVQIKFDRDGNKKLEYSTDGGQSWILIAETVALSSLV